MKIGNNTFLYTTYYILFNNYIQVNVDTRFKTFKGSPSCSDENLDESIQTV